MSTTLKPYPTYKDSGVPWLGEIPAHWEYTQLRRLCKVFSGGTPDKSNPSYWIGGSIPWLSSGEVNKRRIHNAEQTITDEEQRRIVRIAEENTSSLETAITRTQREIDLIREYRTRLVADVVTGKLDVRGVNLAAYGDDLAGLGEALADEGDEGEGDLELAEEAEE